MSFNEAGADAPEIPRDDRRQYPRHGASMRPGRMPRKYRQYQKILSAVPPGFNEAGADAPEIPRPRTPACPRNSSFNEAGADAPEIP